ncbi:MAG TPA: hypothetical protein DD379_23190 [Cyanobacteria bacterium UBA11162]|nr:hypothetical protein [Cyanobacteria bacterium UBA11162]
MNRTVFSSWGYKPPNIYAISMPLPDAPRLPLSGGAIANMSLDSFIKNLETDVKKQKGHYYAYVMEADRDEADTYTLQTWEVYTSPESCYEALVVLYYAPINPYLTYKKHMGEHWAQEYLDELAVVTN